MTTGRARDGAVQDRINAGVEDAVELARSPRGRRLHEQIAARLVERQEEILAPLNVKERRQLDRLLQKFALHAGTLHA